MSALPTVTRPSQPMTTTRRRKDPPRPPRSETASGRMPTPAQLAEIRAEMHAEVDRLCDRWPRIHAEADGRCWPKDRGFDKQPGGGGRSLDCSDDGAPVDLVPVTSVEAAAFAGIDGHDQHGRWLNLLANVRSLLRYVDAKGADLERPVLLGKDGLPVMDGPVIAGSVDASLGETCGLPSCGLPIHDADGTPHKVHRIDGVPFHARTCYYRLYRLKDAAKSEPKPEGEAQS